MYEDSPKETIFYFVYWLIYYCEIVTLLNCVVQITNLYIVDAVTKLKLILKDND